MAEFYHFKIENMFKNTQSNRLFQVSRFGFSCMKAEKFPWYFVTVFSICNEDKMLQFKLQTWYGRDRITITSGNCLFKMRKKASRICQIINNTASKLHVACRDSAKLNTSGAN